MKFIIKTALSVVIIIFLISSPFTLFSKIQTLNYQINGEYNFSYTGILELWNVDTFEGGSVSRTSWLEKRAIEFERQNKGTYIVVRNLTPEQLKLNLESGNTPSLISFGIGVGELFYDKLITLTKSYAVREDLLGGGKVKGKIKAVPIMLGGYNLISNGNLCEKTENLIEEFNNFSVKDKANLGYGNNGYITPLLSLYCNNATTINQVFEERESLDSYDCYDKFINNNFLTLLGTQRDYYRCKNRENNMKMQNNSYCFLGNFSDLVQYVSVFKTDNKTESMCENFIEFLTQEKTQQTLTNINMFSVLNKNIYTDEYKEFETKLLKPLKTLNVFLSNENIKTLKELLNDYFFNSKDVKSEIEKYLI